MPPRGVGSVSPGATSGPAGRLTRSRVARRPEEAAPSSSCGRSSSCAPRERERPNPTASPRTTRPSQVCRRPAYSPRRRTAGPASPEVGALGKSRKARSSLEIASRTSAHSTANTLASAAPRATSWPKSAFLSRTRPVNGARSSVRASSSRPSTRRDRRATSSSDPATSASASALIDERIRELGDWRGEMLACWTLVFEKTSNWLSALMSRCRSRLPTLQAGGCPVSRSVPNAIGPTPVVGDRSPHSAPRVEPSSTKGRPDEPGALPAGRCARAVHRADREFKGPLS